MTAMMILVVFLAAMGPFHSMMGSHDASGPHARMPYAQMQADRTPRADEDKP